MVHINSLPLEIRQIIYEECLVVGEISPYSISDTDQTAQEWTGCDLPTVALLQVSKTIRMEAEPILYQRNHFELGSAKFSQKFFERCLNTPERKLWLKSVTIWLESVDISEADLNAVLDTELGLAREDMLSVKRKDVGPGTWSYTLHDAYKKYLGETIWPRKLSPLLELCSLNKLRVYLDVADCQAGCCTMRHQAVRSFSKGFAMGFPTEFETYGLFEGKVASEKLIRSWTARRLSPLEDTRLLLGIFPEEADNL